MLHLTNAPAAGALREHARRWQGLHLRDVIDADPASRAVLAVEAAGLRLDMSRQRLDQAVLDDLLKLAGQCGWQQARDAMMAGEILNPTEGRAVLHTALRAESPPLQVASEIFEQRERQADFVEAVRAGRILGPGGQTYTDIISIGIGGSELGPRMLVEALGAAPAPALRAHFLGNLDSAGIARRLADVDPRRTLCIVVSKSFTTVETQVCAEYVRRWMLAGGGDLAVQFLAVTAAPERALAFGIQADRIFPMWPWVGGRFSLWSAVGLSAALVLGWPRFEALMAGARAMDEHFASAPAERNLPLLWALVGIWNRNFLGYSSAVIAVYSDALVALPAWLQQLDMESNGKMVGRDGQPLPHPCAPAVWGGVGTSVQHAFFQMLHQGAEVHPVDFVLPRRVDGADADMQRQLLANALAQSAALSHGLAAEAMADTPERAWRACPGNRPSSLVWMEDLSPHSLGGLLAAYEHRCFVQGWLWGVNSFDQFGVELGKQLARGIAAGLSGDESCWPDRLAQEQARRLRDL